MGWGQLFMGYADINRHRSMVFDAVRNRAYTRAMERLVTPDSIVLDLGAGLGVLGMTAAKLGAARVYLVEPAIPAGLLRDLVNANGLDNVTCLESSIEEVAKKTLECLKETFQLTSPLDVLSVDERSL